LSGFEVEGGKADFRESWGRKSRFLPKKKRRCLLRLRGRVVGPEQRTDEVKRLGSAGPLDGRERQGWSDCTRQS
jgi:hypothetical protein